MIFQRRLDACGRVDGLETAVERLLRHVTLEATAIAAGAEVAVRHERDMADLAGIAMRAKQHAAAMHHGAAEADADIEIVEGTEAPPLAIEALAQRRGARLGADEGRKPGHRGEAGADIDALPALERRRTNEAHGFDVVRPRHGDADAKHPPLGPERPHLRDQDLEDLEGPLRGYGRERVIAAADDVSGQIDQRRADADRRHVQTDGEAAVRVEHQAGARQPPALRRLAGAHDEALQFQFADDGGNGLDGEADLAGDVATGNGRLQPDRLEHDPPVIGPPKLLVRTAQGHRHSRPIPLR